MTERASFLVAPSDVAGLRSTIAKIAGFGYSENAVRDRLGVEDLTELQWHSAPVRRAERLSNRDPLALAIDLFLLQGALPAEELDQLLSGSEQDVLSRAGLLAIDETGVARARASLFPVGNRLIFSDHAWPELPHPGYAVVPPDLVMRIGPDSRHLARCTVRRPFRAALDLCTGSGVHALLASPHAGRVLAVDINPRAALCTRFNAQISGAANLDVVIGDLFEGVRDERFDLITANPPFVPSPLDALLFRDGGRSGEDVQKRIVSGLPRHLAPGGMAQIVTELGERDHEPLVARVREWLNGAPLDIHLLRLNEHTAMKYAVGHAQGDDFRTRLDSIDEWAGNLRYQGYVRIVSVVITFQWSDVRCGSPWERVDESQPPHRPAGTEIEAIFRAERGARQLDTAELRSSVLCRTGPIALLDAKVLGSDLRAKTKATLMGQALTMEHQIDAIEREILERLEGPIPVSELIGMFPVIKMDEPTVIAAVRSLLRRRLVRIDS
jgi:hypothetical protein